jgi:predicted AAA+ superfamily ATPase
LQAAFGYDLPRYLAFGGYPGAVALEGSPDRWYAYMKDAIVEAVIGKDILQSRTVAKPALFRQAFEILCAYPAQEISYTKLLGQLQDGGNTDLIRHYIELYGAAFLLHALQKYSAKTWLSRSSSPKMLPACPALYSLVAGVSVATDAEQRGRAFELAVGAELMQQPGQLFYWRERNDEVDFVLQYPDRLYAIEVKSGRKKSGRGLEAFCRQAPQALRVIVTPDNFAHFSQDPRAFMAQVGV